QFISVTEHSFVHIPCCSRRESSVTPPHRPTAPPIGCPSPQDDTGRLFTLPATTCRYVSAFAFSLTRYGWASSRLARWLRCGRCRESTPVFDWMFLSPLPSKTSMFMPVSSHCSLF